MWLSSLPEGSTSCLRASLVPGSPARRTMYAWLLRAFHAVSLPTHRPQCSGPLWSEFAHLPLPPASHSTQTKNLCWTLFVHCRLELSEESTDLSESLQLLACCMQFCYGNLRRHPAFAVPELEACWSQRHGVVAALCRHIMDHDAFASDGIATWHSVVRPLLRDLIANLTLLSSKTSGGSYVGDIHSDRCVNVARICKSSEWPRLLQRDFALLSTNTEQLLRAYQTSILSRGFVDEAVLLTGEPISSSDTALSKTTVRSRYLAQIGLGQTPQSAPRVQDNALLSLQVWRSTPLYHS